jgi:ATP/maltotriose-dependent transcriptional regulator MalT
LAAQLEALFGDASEDVLREIGCGDSWDLVLGAVPASVWVGAPRASLPALAAVLSLRTHWAGQQAWRPAAATTRGLVRVLDARLGAEHPDTLAEVAMLGDLAARSGRPEAALTLLDRAWRGLQAAPWTRRVGVARRYLDVLLAQGAHGRAAEVVAACKGPAEGTPHAVRVATWDADVHRASGDVDRAYVAIQRGWAQTGGTVPTADVVRCALLYIALARQLGRIGEAVAPARRVVAEASHPEAAGDAAVVLVEALEAVGQVEEALRTVTDLLDETRRVSPPHPKLVQRLALAARIWWARGRVAEAEGLLLEALEAARRQHGAVSIEVARRHAALGRLCLATARPVEAVGWLESAWALVGTGSPDQRSIVVADLIRALHGGGREASGRGERDQAVPFAMRIVELSTTADLRSSDAYRWATTQR